MEQYKFLPHTADMRLRVYGKNIKELFKNAALGIADYLSVEGEKKKKVKLNININAIDIESLIVSWLNEIIYKITKDRIIISKICIREMKKDKIKAKIEGTAVKNGNRRTHEIKAATYHNLKIKKINNNYKTEIIFDI